MTQQSDSSGQQATIHFRGIGASSAIAKEVPDLVILDLDRAFIDAGSLCELPRKDPKGVKVPVLLDQVARRAIVHGDAA